MTVLAAAAACCLCLVATLAGQDRTPPRSWSDLRHRLSAPDIAADERVALLEDFLARRRDDAARRQDDALRARLALATEHIARFDVVRAGAEFETTADLAPLDELDIRGAALYGLAQTHELTGETESARAIYARIRDELGGTRYRDFASVALDRIGRPDAERPRAGQPAPEFGPTLDRRGESQTLRRLRQRGGAALLVFVDPADMAESGPRLHAVLEAADDGGLGTASIVTFVTTGDGPGVAALARDPRFGMPIVTTDDPQKPTAERFLSPAFLLYEVRSVPATVLVGPDGTILGRDLPPRRLRAVLEALRR